MEYMSNNNWVLIHDGRLWCRCTLVRPLVCPQWRTQELGPGYAYSGAPRRRRERPAVRAGRGGSVGGRSARADGRLPGGKRGAQWRAAVRGRSGGTRSRDEVVACASARARLPVPYPFGPGLMDLGLWGSGEVSGKVRWAMGHLEVGCFRVGRELLHKMTHKHKETQF
jgi:hypothetical protein